MLKILEVYMKRSTGRNRKYAKVECECGVVFETRLDGANNNVKSCGCLHRKQAIINVSKNHKHKLSGTKLYRAWQNMKSRCYNSNDKSYNDYGGRGIVICDSWHVFENFKCWSFDNGFAEETSHSIDRKDNNKGYSPDNCRWVDNRTQSRNRRSNVLVNSDVGLITAVEFSERSGKNYSAIVCKVKRLEKLGLEITESALLTSFTVKGSKLHLSKLTEKQVIEIRELSKEGSTLAELSSKYNVSKSNVSNIVRRKIWKHI